MKDKPMTALQRILSENAGDPTLSEFKKSRKKILDHEATVTRISQLPEQSNKLQTEALQKLLSDPGDKNLSALMDAHTKHEATRFAVNWLMQCSPVEMERSQPKHAEALRAALDFTAAQLKERYRKLEEQEKALALESGVTFSPSAGLTGLKDQQDDIAKAAATIGQVLRTSGNTGQVWNQYAGLLSDLE